MSLVEVYQENMFGDLISKTENDNKDSIAMLFITSSIIIFV